MTFAQRRNRLTAYVSERIPIDKRRMTVLDKSLWRCCNYLYFDSIFCLFIGDATKQIPTKQCSKNRTKLEATDWTKVRRVLRTIPTRLQMAACHAARLTADRQSTSQIILTMMSLRSLNKTVEKIAEVSLLDCLGATFFVDVTSCNMVNMYRRFRGTCRFHCQGRMINVLVHIYGTTLRHNPENSSQLNIVRISKLAE